MNRCTVCYKNTEKAVLLAVGGKMYAVCYDCYARWKWYTYVLPMDSEKGVRKYATLKSKKVYTVDSNTSCQ